MGIHDAIRQAERVLVASNVPGGSALATHGEVDPRWHAILEVGEYIETHPDEVWAFIRRWGTHPDDDIRAAIATCLLEHLLEHHFERFFPLVEQAAEHPRFADTFSLCWKFGQAQQPINAARFDALRQALASRRARR
ncbi:MAG TPA: hypothetical protein VNI78_10030 [Vicinamibacterales bacterium]|nr:hypothetical protein [Vicinamibacterales bacterium]